MDNNSIEPFIHKKIVVLRKDASAEAAARAMSQQRIGCVVVSNGRGRFIGLVTDRDILRKIVAEGRDLDTPIGSILMGRLISVGPGSRLDDVLKIMETYGIRRVPVIRRHGGKEHGMGLLSLDDLIVAKRVSRDQLSRILRSQVRPSMAFPRLWRSRARREQTFGLFMRKIRQATGLETGRAESFLLHFFSALIQRLPSSGAEEFISQLPGILQDSLLTYPTGPNRKITAKTLRAELQLQFNLTRRRVEQLLQVIWRTIHEITESGELDDVMAQLPLDLQDLLTEEQRLAGGESFAGPLGAY
jgi:CBS domain-containing protein